MNPRIGGTARSIIGLAAVMAALSSVAPALSNRVAPVRTQPGERLSPPPPPRLRGRPVDIERFAAASDKRSRRRLRNINAMHAGGWASTQAWLRRLAYIEAAKLQQ
jgi:hypothetical protein